MTPAGCEPTVENMALDLTQRAFLAFVRSDQPAWPSGEVTLPGTGIFSEIPHPGRRIGDGPWRPPSSRQLKCG